MDPRTALVKGLRALADWYEANPEVPLPPSPDIAHCVMAGDDAAGMAELRVVADALGEPVDPTGPHPQVVRDFAGLKFHAFYVLQRAAAEYMARQRIARAATPEQLAEVTQ